MKNKTTTKPDILVFIAGALLVSFCGLLLGETFLGQSWANASYDYLFRFGTHPISNNVVLIMMDNDAYDQFHQNRGQPWDRGLHARLLNRLADDHCRMVVLDSFLRKPGAPEKDAALAAAIKRNHMVLMAEQAVAEGEDFVDAHPILPCEPFLNAAGTNWGVAWFDPDLDLVVRRNWPFPSPGPYSSISETAVKTAGVPLDARPAERWLRYYGQTGAWIKLSYGFAMTQPKDYFRDKIVFIGSQPKTILADAEEDKFRTPYTRWTGDAMGGVEIIITSFLNLANHDWLWRPASWIEYSVFITAGILGGAGLCCLRIGMAFICGICGALIITLIALSLSYATNVWLPWLAIIGGQLPCALAWAVIANKIRYSYWISPKGKEVLVRPRIPGFKLPSPPFGRGAYGNVWLARRADGEWFALKVIYRSNFAADSDSYEREFEGINAYKTVSGEHPGLLRVDLVSEKTGGYFYYAMELGDSLEPDWQKNPSNYKPCDLAGKRARAAERRLSISESVHIGLVLTEALGFLHQRGLTHRDIKPQNIIFVNGRPKLADFGLVKRVRLPEEIKTIVGTPGYMPPPPEPPGTLQADIYALGMVLYVISTGRDAAFFPEIATVLMNTGASADFLMLNAIILKACHARLDCRYASTIEMHRELFQLAEKLELNKMRD